MADVRIQLRDRHAGQVSVVAGAKRFNVLMCGRRFGKTALGVDLAVNGALDGQTWGWFAPAYKYLEEAWRELVAILAPIPGFQKNEQEHRLTVPTGGSIECWSMDSDDPGRGRKYHGIVVDEAGLVPRLAHMFHTALRPTLADYQGLAWFLGTPKGVGDFSALYHKGQGGDPDWASWRMPTASNPFIVASEIEDMRLSMPEQVFRQEILGEPLTEGEHPIGLDHIKACVGPLGSGPSVVYGSDLARSVDFTTLCGMNAGAEVTRIERWKSPWGVTKARLLNDLQSVVTYMDSTGVGDPIVEDLQRAGARVIATVFTARFKQQLIEHLITGIQQRCIRFPDGWLRGELESLTAEKTAVGTRYTAPPGLHDDGVMALALCYWGYSKTYHPPRPERIIETKLDDRAPRFNHKTGTFDRVDPLMALNKLMGHQRPPLGAGAFRRHRGRA